MRSTVTAVGLATVALGVVALGSSAHAQQERSYWERHMPAPTNAFELKLGTGYTQGFGNISPNRSISDASGAGIGFSADLDWRIDPMVSAGVETQYQEFAAPNSTGSRGLAANVGATFHALPTMRGDPWLRLGTGYRLLWEVGPNSAPSNTNMFHGFDLVTAKVGYDFRASPDVAVAPVIGADLQTFIWENANTLGSAQLGTFIYAGLQGRFDTGTSTMVPVASAR